jgi:diaminohydroxyphosphoribosylaminopyrimidine deaminase/5-amino-6-(5-phosphoribosylamino)uracil reductase
MSSDADLALMRLAADAARRAEGRTRPNPIVGCVIARGGEVLAVGYHTRAGQPHAEVEALRQLGPDGARGADVYVTLEPCCHYGRTPPCVDALIAAGVARVFVGMRDPNPRVDGGGMERLRAAGIEVIEAVAEADCIALNRPYIKHMTTGLPWVVAKWAMTLDGKIAAHTGHSRWISSPEARQVGHALRDRCDAIMVGRGTLEADDPELTCRGIEGGRDPWRFVLDARLDSLERRVYAAALAERGAPTVALVGPHAPQAAREVLEARGHRAIEVALDVSGRLELGACLRAVGELGLMSVLVEGGAVLLGALWDAGLVDEVCAFIAPSVLGGQSAPSPVGGQGCARADRAWQLEGARWEQVGTDMMVRGEVRCAQGSGPDQVEDP